MIELILDEENLIEGVQAMGVVDDPAIMVNFVAFNGEKKVKFEAQDSEKRILLGPAMIPNLPIFRRNEEGESYYNYYTPETVMKASQIFMRNGRQNSATLNHEIGVGGMTIVESWIVEDPEKDKASLYGFNVPKGTWMISMKVWDESLWTDFIKTGILKGFSIEGYFSDDKKEREMMKQLLRQVTRQAYVEAKEKKEARNG